jgi:ABC-type Mn2+/Zn2+ transport system permease subunit
MYDSLIAPFRDNEFLARALGAGVLVALCCAVVGSFVVLRGLAFVADALAHGVLPGIAVAVLTGFPVVLGAAAGTVVMMGGVSLITRRSRLSSDTAIGLFFAGMLALGVMITSRSRSFTGDLTRILFGELLGVDRSELFWQAVACVFVGVVAWVCRRPFLLLCIEPELAATSGFRVRLYETLMLMIVAVAIIASFQSVGTLLVFGMLLAPASTAALVTHRLGVMMAVAAVLGSLCTYAGLLLSYHADLAAGASVVAVAVGVFLLTFAGVEVRAALTQRGAVGVPPGALQRHSHTHDDGAHVHVHGAGEHPHGHIPGEHR